nr:MAG TPA: tail protein [Caudoviricetes sp.]
MNTMANQYVNKVIIGAEVKLDLTGDDVTPDKLTKGIKAHDKSGAPIVGTNTYNADTTDATATAAEILQGKTAYAKGAKVTGTMPNKGAVTLNVIKKSVPVTIPMGFHDGSGKAQVDPTEAAKIIPENIRDGINILGVAGTMSGTEGAKPQAKTVTPTFEAQEITPDSPEYNFLSSVTVNAIPVSYTDNEQGGQTLKVGA